MTKPKTELINTIVDGLYSRDVNLFALALRAMTEDEASEIIESAKRETEIDIKSSDIWSSLTPTQIDELQKFETNHRTYLLSIIEKRYENDCMLLKKVNQQDKDSSFRRKLAVGMLIYSCVFLCMIVWIPIPESQNRYVDYILGFLTGTVVTTVINYFYGTSSKTEKQDASISDETETKNIDQSKFNSTLSYLRVALLKFFSIPYILLNSILISYFAHGCIS